MSWRLIAAGCVVLVAVLAVGSGALRRGADPVEGGPVVVAGVKLYPLPQGVIRSCRAAQAHTRVTILCPTRLPRPVRNDAGAAAPTFDSISAFPYGHGVDLSYSAETGQPVLDEPGRFFHMQVITQDQPLPPHTRPARIGGRAGLLAPATSLSYAEESYFANHLRFFWTERGTKYAATLHWTGPSTRRLLDWLVGHLRPARELTGRPAAERERVRTFPVPVPGPVSLAFGRGRVWVAGQGDRSVSASWLARIDPDSGRPAGPRIRAARGGGAASLAFGGGPPRPLWVALRGPPYRPGLQRLAGRRGGLRQPVRLRPELVAIAASRSGLWVADYGGWPGSPTYRGGTIVRLDRAGRRVVARTRVGRAPADIALGAGSLWVTNDLDGTVSRIDLASNRVVVRIRVGGRPTGVATGTGAVWVADFAGGKLVRIDPRTNAVTGRTAVGPGPRGVAVGAGGVWVTSELADTVTRVDPATAVVIERLSVGGEPVDVTVGGGFVWTANAADRAVSRIAP